MALCSLGGATELKLCNFRSEFSKIGHNGLVANCKMKCDKLEKLWGLRGIRLVSMPAHRRMRRPLGVSCASDAKEGDIDNASLEAKLSTQDQIFPRPFKVQSLLTSICDTTTIAEVELKLGSFRVYVKRDLAEKTISAAAPSLPPAPTNTLNQTPDSNGSTAASSLAMSEPKSLSGSLQSILETASDEGLVIIQSPKVGFFRTSRTIKGKRAPPSCKEKQQVKEGQVLCYVEQLGGEIPIESDVSGEVIKILRTDGEPVGYGDALIAILPSFPGIKKLQ